VPGLKVAATASSFSFKGKRVPPAEMGAQLGVAYLVDGTVQKVGNRVRVRAQLIKAADGTAVWTSETLEHEVKDMFAVQDEVVGSVAKSLQVQLGAKPAALTINPEAYRLYYEGRRVWSLRGEAELQEKAEELFRQAIAADPRLGRAYAGLVDARRNSARITFADRNSKRAQELVELADTALRLEPESAEAFAARGGAYWQMWRLADAERDLRTALRLNPNHAEAHQILGRVLATDGRLDEALVSLKLASELDPLTSRIFDNYASTLLLAPRPGEALVQAERALALQPESEQALRAKMHALSALGRHDEAIVVARSPGMRGSAYRTVPVFMAAGLPEEAARMHATTSPRFMLAGNRALAPIILASMGRFEEALNALSPGEAMMNSIAALCFNPALDPVRSDPRFLRYLTSLGIKEAHDRAQVWRAANQRTEDSGQRTPRKKPRIEEQIQGGLSFVCFAG
jgi:tetratricopeptide (TPR) repeat protein